MSVKKIETSHIENLITEYVKANGIDSNVDKMLGIISKYTEKSSYFEFKDIIFLSCTLNVSPDYITNVSDNPTLCDSVLLRILKNFYTLTDDYKNYLADYTDFLCNLCTDNNDHMNSGIKIRIVEKDSMEFLKEKNPEQIGDDELYTSRVAQTREKYNSDPDDDGKK